MNKHALAFVALAGTVIVSITTAMMTSPYVLLGTMIGIVGTTIISNTLDKGN